MKTVRPTIPLFFFSLLLLLGLQVPPASNQDGSPAPEPPKGPKPAPITLETLVPAAVELPRGMSRVHGDHPAKPHAPSFYDDPCPLSVFPVPKGKASFSLASEQGVPGTVYLLEYGEDGPDNAIPFLKALFWGEDEHPTEEHPEEMIVHGRFLILISFPLGDPAAEWFKERLRTKFGIPTFRQRPDLLSIGRKIWAAYEEGDYEAGIQILDENALAVADWSYGWYMRGEFCLMKGDRLGQERAYRRALELHYGRADPLEGGVVWACLDGLGQALVARRKLDATLITLERAVTLAKEIGLDPEETSISSYNLACAYALLERYSEALQALKTAIAANPEWKEYCLADDDLAEALKRREFQEIILGR